MSRLLWIAVIGVLFLPWSARPQEVVVYYHTDAIGSVRAMTDEAGVVIHRFDFRPFGEAWLPPPNSDTRQFAGKERDRETGLELDYFGARYHLPVIGRFTTVDPVMNIEAAMTDPQRWNRYSYVNNNPIRFVDPDSRDRIEIYQNQLARAFARGEITHAQLRSGMIGEPWAFKAWIAATLLTGGTAAELGLIARAALWGRGLVTAISGSAAIVSRRDQLLAAAQNPGLRDGINNLFRQGAKIGDGSSMAAYKYEQATGQLLSPTGHGQKLIDRLGQLQRILTHDGLSAGDRAIAERLVTEIKKALR